MAHVTLLTISASSFVGDNDSQLVASDFPAAPANHIGRPVLTFDDNDARPEAAVSAEFIMPGQYAGGTLIADIVFAMESDTTNDIAIDMFVEAKTPDTSGEPLDMETEDDWDTANSVTKSVGGTTAGDPLKLSVTLANKDSVAAGDLVRFGIRRDTDSANDDAVGDLFVYSVEIWEST